MSAFIVVAAVMAAIAAAAVAVPLLRSRRSRMLGVVSAVVMIAAAAALYPLWSNWDWHAAAEGKAAAGPDVQAMVAKLEQHLKEQPNDQTGWSMMGRSYMALERTDDAVAAYEHAYSLGKDADTALNLGEALSVRAGGEITPQASQLFEEAVSFAPDNPKALFYAGFAAALRGDTASARKRWQALKDLHPPQQIEQMLDARLAELGPAGAAGNGAAGNGATGNGNGAAGNGATGNGAAGNGNGAVGSGAAGPSAPSLGATSSIGPVTGASAAGTNSTPASSAAPRVDVNIFLAPALKARVTDGAPLFVFAREPGGAGPPLAAKRLTTAAIGTQVSLSAADSMIPGRVLSSGQKVSITARVSFSGQPTPAAGDLYGEAPYEVGSGGVLNLVIDRVAE